MTRQAHLLRFSFASLLIALPSGCHHASAPPAPLEHAKLGVGCGHDTVGIYQVREVTLLGAKVGNQARYEVVCSPVLMVRGVEEDYRYIDEFGQLGGDQGPTKMRLGRPHRVGTYLWLAYSAQGGGSGGLTTRITTETPELLAATLDAACEEQARPKQVIVLPPG